MSFVRTLNARFQWWTPPCTVKAISSTFDEVGFYCQIDKVQCFLRRIKGQNDLHNARVVCAIFRYQLCSCPMSYPWQGLVNELFLLENMFCQNCSLIPYCHLNITEPEVVLLTLHNIKYVCYIISEHSMFRRLRQNQDPWYGIFWSSNASPT